MAKIDTSLNVNSITIISAGTTIIGEIVSPTDIRIDGNFEGKLMAKGRVVIGESAVIKGDIICDTVDLWGNVQGDIYTRDTLSLKDGCQVNGNIHIRRLFVELGAIFNGTCRMITEEEFAKLTKEVFPKNSAPVKGDSKGAAVEEPTKLKDSERKS